MKDCLSNVIIDITFLRSVEEQRCEGFDVPLDG